MALGAGLWLDADVLLLKPVEIDPAKPTLRERPRQLGNSVLYLPPRHPIVAAFENLMAQEALTPQWLALRHRLTSRCEGCVANKSPVRYPGSHYGPASLTALARRAGALRDALPKKSFYAVHAEPKRVFERGDFSALVRDPDIIGLHISPKGRGNRRRLRAASMPGRRRGSGTVETPSSPMSSSERMLGDKIV